MLSIISFLSRVCHWTVGRIQNVISKGLHAIQVCRWSKNHRILNADAVLDFNLKFGRRAVMLIPEKPQTIQEKLMWLNIYEVPWSEQYDKPLKSVCADKLLVKEYAKAKLGVDIGVKTLHVYNRAQDIVWTDLPDKFIIKVNHNSGGTIICRDKSQLDTKNCAKLLEKWMKEDFTFRNGFESHYHWIDRLILVEELLEDENQKESLIDYKFWCFNGKPEFYTINSNHGHGAINHYNLNGTLLKFSRKDYPMDAKKLWPMPRHLDKMIEYSTRLSDEFNFVRVDFYEVNGKVFLGEMTFVPGAADFCYMDEKDNYRIGQLLSIKDS